jgi:hypothetical protein
MGGPTVDSVGRLVVGRVRWNDHRCAVGTPVRNARVLPSETGSQNHGRTLRHPKTSPSGLRWLPSNLLPDDRVPHRQPALLHFNRPVAGIDQLVNLQARPRLMGFGVRAPHRCRREQRWEQPADPPARHALQLPSGSWPSWSSTWSRWPTGTTVGATPDGGRPRDGRGMPAWSRAVESSRLRR